MLPSLVTSDGAKFSGSALRRVPGHTPGWMNPRAIRPEVPQDQCLLADPILLRAISRQSLRGTVVMLESVTS